jgi:sugar transferase (PEP-CTERM/EpsH1 system associated)
MARLLFLAHRLPYPPNKGDKVRSYHLLAHLARRHEIYLATFIDDPDDWRHLGRVRAMCADMHVAALDPRLGRLRSLSGLWRGEALTLPYYRQRGVSDWVRATCARVHIDAAVVFSSAMAQYAQAIPGEATLVDFVDVDSAKWSQYASMRRWPMSWLYRREARLLLECERAIAARAAASCFVTENEAAVFRALAPGSAARVHAMCNGVDADFFSPVHESASPYAPGEIALVFTGAMDYWPNIDAVTWFAAEVLPGLRAAWPALRFHIVGRSPTPAVQALAGPGVAVSGTVPDVRPYLRHAAAVVAPLRVARGIQNKILEAMAMGRAVVASAACAEAVDAHPGEDFLVAADANDFGTQIGRLLQSADLAQDIGQAARRAVLARYSWGAHLAVMDRFLRLVPGVIEGASA